MNKYRAIHSAVAADAKRVASEHHDPMSWLGKLLAIREQFLLPDGGIGMDLLDDAIAELQQPSVFELELQAESIAEALSIRKRKLRIECSSCGAEWSDGHDCTSDVRTAIDPLAELGTRGLR